MAIISVKAKPAATDVFLANAITTEISGGIALRKAWGKTTLPSVWPKVNPMDRAASACPRLTEFTPERTASATNDAV